MTSVVEKIIALSDGKMKSREIAEIVGCRVKYVQKTWVRLNLKRPRQAPPRGECNPSWSGGRVVQRDGYISVPAPEGHPSAVVLKGKKVGRILEHRLAMEKKLGRYLLRTEIVHHLNGCRLDNRIENLALYESNGLHLKEELTGKSLNLSERGRESLRLPRKGYAPRPKCDTYDLRRKSGEIRRQQILLARELLGKGSPYLLGTERYLENK